MKFPSKTLLIMSAAALALYVLGYVFTAWSGAYDLFDMAVFFGGVLFLFYLAIVVFILTIIACISAIKFLRKHFRQRSVSINGGQPIQALDNPDVRLPALSNERPHFSGQRPSRQVRQRPLALIGLILLHLALMGVPLVAAYFTPHIYLNYQINYQQRMEVVRLYQQGKFKIKSEELGFMTENGFDLPPNYAYLSSEGSVGVEKDKHGQDELFFYDGVGVMDGYRAYVYTPSGAINACGVRHQWNVHWYYIEC